MDPGQKGRVADAIGRPVREDAADPVVDAAHPVDGGDAVFSVIIGGDGDEFGRAPQSAVHVGAEIRMVPDPGQYRRMQHLQQQAGNAADHHGDDVAIDPPGDRVRGEQGIGAAQDGALALCGVVEQVGDPAADRDLGGFDDQAASRHAFNASRARRLISRFLARPRSFIGILTPASSTLGASSGGSRP